MPGSPEGHQGGGFTILGHDVRAVISGPAALEIVEVFAPDVVLLDIGLPGMNGYDVVKELRKKPGSGRTAYVALTGYGRDQDRRQIIAAGFDRHLVKPIDPSSLESLFDEIVAPR